MNEIFKLTPWSPSHHLVSIGCGSAWWEINLVLQHPAKTLLLIDPDNQQLNETAIQESIHYFEGQTGKQNQTEIQFLQKKVEVAQLIDQSAHGIWIFNALHELDSPSLAIKKSFDTLKKGGRLFIEEEISWTSRIQHDGCGKALYFESEIDTLAIEVGFIKKSVQQKDQKALYLIYEK